MLFSELRCARPRNRPLRGGCSRRAVTMPIMLLAQPQHAGAAMADLTPRRFRCVRSVLSSLFPNSNEEAYNGGYCQEGHFVAN